MSDRARRTKEAGSAGRIPTLCSGKDLRSMFYRSFALHSKIKGTAITRDSNRVPTVNCGPCP
jgi:hypothetical protein